MTSAVCAQPHKKNAEQKRVPRLHLQEIRFHSSLSAIVAYTHTHTHIPGDGKASALTGASCPPTGSIIPSLNYANCEATSARTHTVILLALVPTQVRDRVRMMRRAVGPVRVFNPAFIDFAVSFSRLFGFLAFLPSQLSLSSRVCVLVSLSLSTLPFTAAKTVRTKGEREGTRGRREEDGGREEGREGEGDFKAI